MTLSVVVTTRNEEAHIAACLDAFAPWRDEIETIVVDNASTDGTKRLAAAAHARVFDQGPERCAQRNRGWREARGEWVLILDADMIVPEATVREILAICRAPRQDSSPDAYWVREVRAGRGLRVAVRNFERSFYDGTCIDALRLFRRDVLAAVDGYDENLTAGGEDWELDIRILARGVRCALTQGHLIHDEQDLTRARLLAKKAYYARGLKRYKAKWPDHPAVRKQFSPWYRFVGVFVEQGKWRKILRHPLLFALVLGERVSVGFVYLLNRGKGVAHG